VDDGGDGVEEAEGILTGQVEDGGGQGRGGQGAGGDDHIVPVFGRQAGDLLAHDGDEGVGLQLRRYGLGEAVAVDGEGTAGGDLMGIAAGHDEGVQRPHLGVQQADGVVLPVVRAEGVGTDQFRKAVRVVGVGLHARHAAHLVQNHGHAGLGNLPGSLGAGEAAADNVDGLESVRHGRLLAGTEQRG